VSRPSLSERIERSTAGQVVISIAIVLVLLAEVATHLPTGSALHRSVEDQANTLIRHMASEQSWGVFAPDPRQTSLRIEGHVTFEDGSTEVWTLPEGARIGGNLRYYRWRKWLERVRDDDFRELWEPTARWIAGLYDDRASPVAKVELVRLFHPNTVQGEQAPYEAITYYTYIPEPGATAS
jgi:hypothetical protein